ncbi:MAG: alpha/beta hydrolase [Bacteroidota bacterium]
MNTIKHLLTKIFLLTIILTSIQSTMQAQTNAPVKDIVIVHGAFADGSGWDAVYNILKSRGYNVTIVQNPLSSLEDDVEATNRAIDKKAGNVVLVGHSWGGTVITQAGVNPKVSSLVYVAAFVPDLGQSTLDLVKTAPPAAENGILPPDEKGMIYYDQAKFHAGFCADVPKEKAEFMFASQGPINVKCFITPVTQAAWKTKPSFAILSTDDKSINPVIQQAMYKNAGAKVTEVKGSHAIYISKAKAVADVIELAAKGTAVTVAK